MIDATGPVCRNLVSVAPGSGSLKQCGQPATINREWYSHADIEALWGANLPETMCDQCDSDRYRPQLAAAMASLADARMQVIADTALYDTGQG